MSGLPPSPQTTLGILLGASEWQSPTLQDSRAFARSAHKVRDYFLHSGPFKMPPENWKDLFDTSLGSFNEIDQEIGDFLGKRQAAMEQMGTPARDLIVYYIGHGAFAFGSEQEYLLTIRRTRDENLRASSIPFPALAETLKTKARQLRRILILDCCFAGAALKYMQSAGEQVAFLKAISALEMKSKSIGRGLPQKGTTLICSSSHDEASLFFPDGRGTMFSEALIRTLLRGNAGQPEKSYLSVDDLKGEIIDTVAKVSQGKGPLPNFHSPDQSEGDVASVRLFPNPRAKAEPMRKAEEERTRQANKHQQLSPDRLYIKDKSSTIEMNIENVRINEKTQQRVVILKAVEQPERYLFIWIAHPEAYAIAVKLQGTPQQSPLAYDTMKDIIEGLGASVISIIISDLIEGVFYARIRINIRNKQIEINAGPAVAIALAVRCAAPILVEKSVLEQASVGLEGTVEGKG